MGKAPDAGPLTAVVHVVGEGRVVGERYTEVQYCSRCGKPLGTGLHFGDLVGVVIVAADETMAYAERSPGRLATLNGPIGDWVHPRLGDITERYCDDPALG